MRNKKVQNKRGKVFDKSARMDKYEILGLCCGGGGGWGICVCVLQGIYLNNESESVKHIEHFFFLERGQYYHRDVDLK